MALTEPISTTDREESRRQTEAAAEELLRLLPAIPGVLAVRVSDPVQTVQVKVASRRSETSERLYQLEAELMDRYPASRLDLWVSLQRRAPAEMAAAEDSPAETR